MFTLRNSLRLDQDKFTENELEMRLLGGVLKVNKIHVDVVS